MHHVEKINKHAAQLNDLKMKLIGRTNEINGLDKSLDTSSSNLSIVYNNLMNELKAIPVEAEEPVIAMPTNEVTDEPVSSRNVATVIETPVIEPADAAAGDEQFQALDEKAKQITELSRALLSDDLKQAIKLMKSDKVEEAKAIIQAEIKKDPTNWTARKHMAKIYMKEKNYNKALEEINKALDCFKQDMGE